MTSSSPLTERRLNRATLARQLLLERGALDVPAAVRQVVGLQAQEAASPYIALWARVRDLDAAQVDRAFADGSIVKASLMRLTLHAVVAEDYRPFHEAMQPSLQGSRLYDRRFTVAGVSVGEVEALLPEVLAFAGEPRTNADVEAWLGERLGADTGRQVWWALRTFAPLRHAPVGTPWSFAYRPAYRAAPPPHDRPDPEGALATLIRRYLEGFGPASVADVAQFAMITRARVKAAVESMGDGLVRVPGSGGKHLLDVPGGLLPDEDVPAPPRLLPMWDSTLFSYDDRSRIIPPEYRRVLIRTNGDTLSTLLVDGRVAGVWRLAGEGIEATAFEPLREDAWDGLATEARSLLAFLGDRDPKLYSRYARWWTQLPVAERRLLR